MAVIFSVSSDLILIKTIRYGDFAVMSPSKNKHGSVEFSAGQKIAELVYASGIQNKSIEGVNSQHESEISSNVAKIQH